jgi:hypothetical protein
VSISAPRLDLWSKSQQILALARARSTWDFQLLGAKARAMPVNFSDALTLNLYVTAHQKMTHRPIVAYLSLERMSAREIHGNIIATPGPDAVSYSSVTSYLSEARFPHSKPESHPADVQRDLNDSDQAISAALEDIPFTSMRQLSGLTHLPSTTIYRRLTQSLGFVVCRLRWVPHALSDAQKYERVNLSWRLLRMLEIQRDRSWHDIVTLDESWFYLSMDYEFIWLPRDKKVPERERHTIQSKNSCSQSFGIHAVSI